MKSIHLLALAIAAVAMVSCNQDNKSTSAKSENVEITSAPVKIADPKVDSLFHGYINLKNALVASNVENAKDAGAKLVNRLKNIQGCENTAKLAKEIAGSDDLKIQREKFVLLNAELIPLLKQTDIKAGSVFLQYCPMANNGNGAYWLAAEPDIKNPYYGDEMLECGTVKEEFK